MVTFKLQPFTPAQQALLAALKKQGAVVDTVLLSPEQPPNDLEATCRAAALAALDYLAAQEAERQTHLPPDVPRFSIERVPGTTPMGRCISFAELLGDGYDLEQHQARLFRGYNKTIVHSAEPGLANALLNPPYSLRTVSEGEFGSLAYVASQHRQLGELLRDYLATVLHVATPADAETLTCFAWSTDWASYFELGHEWWGAYCWTIYDPGRVTIAVLLAASTD